MNLFTHKNDRTSANIVLLQVMRWLRLVWPKFQLFCCSVNSCHTQNTMSQTFITNQCIVVLFYTFLSGYVLLNASQRAVYDFGVKKCFRMNTCPVCEYSFFTPAHILRNWWEQCPSTKCDLGRSHTKSWESVMWGWTCF